MACPLPFPSPFTSNALWASTPMGILGSPRSLKPFKPFPIMKMGPPCPLWPRDSPRINPRIATQMWLPVSFQFLDVLASYILVSFPKVKCWKKTSQVRLKHWWAAKYFRWPLSRPTETFARSETRRIRQCQLHWRLPKGQGLHCHSRTVAVDFRLLLANDLGAKSQSRGHDHQSGGTRTSKLASIRICGLFCLPLFALLQAIYISLPTCRWLNEQRKISRVMS